ncbi:hypothetical protein [Nereida sp. MMG025]|uniref:hypothetical protein n=1 Tax=Nereida sp. MMG025 TaxID=2909981 RepID=UPI001F1689C8|nr:hypothetical protein [Nereida sp. MMG025]MCF6445025.1 hypothetical protein [Nereida sp. MMG025]
MQDFTPPDIVPDNQNGLVFLRQLCLLFDMNYDDIPENLRGEALQVFAGLYVYPAIENTADRHEADRELRQLVDEYFPVEDLRFMDGVWMALNMDYGTSNTNVRTAWGATRTEMMFYRAKWTRLTIGDPDDLIQGYRWRRIVTGVIESVVLLVTAGGAYGTIETSIARGIEGGITGGRTAAWSSFLARLRSGGSGIVQAATEGRGVTSLASRGGVLGLLGSYVIGTTYLGLKDDEEEIRAAIALRVLNGEISEDYLDDINGPIDVIRDMARERWYE